MSVSRGLLLRWTIFALLGTIAAYGASPARLAVQANGRPIATREFAQGQFAVFELSGPADFAVCADFNVRWVDVRPLSAGVTANVEPDHRTVHFHVAKPQPLTVEFNRDLTYVLHLFPYGAETSAPPTGPHAKVFGPGIHDAGLIELHDDDTLYLAPGAWVRGAVRAVGAKRIAIRGRGVLDGSDIASIKFPRSPATASGVPDYANGDGNLAYFDRCAAVTLEGVTMFNSVNWTVFVRRCREVRISGVNILNPSTHYGDDGFDLVSSSDVTIDRVFVRTNDDCVVVKNIDDLDTRNIVVRGSTFWNMPVGGNALEIGFELRTHGVAEIAFRDCDILHVERGSALSIHNGDDGEVSDVEFEDIRVEDARRKLIDFAVLYAQYGLDRPPTETERQRRMDVGGVWDGEQRLTPQEYARFAGGRGRIRDVRVRRVRVVDGALPYSIIAGFDPAHGVTNVMIEDLEYLGQRLRDAREAKLVVDSAADVILR